MEHDGRQNRPKNFSYITRRSSTVPEMPSALTAIIAAVATKTMTLMNWKVLTIDGPIGCRMSGMVNMPLPPWPLGSSLHQYIPSLVWDQVLQSLVSQKECRPWKKGHNLLKSLEDSNPWSSMWKRKYGRPPQKTSRTAPKKQPCIL